MGQTLSGAFVEMLTNGTYAAIYSFTIAFAGVFGGLLVAWGIYMVHKAANDQRGDVKYSGAFWTILIGGALLNVPQMMGVLEMSVFANTPCGTDMLAYQCGSGSSSPGVIQAIHALIAVVGYIAFVRGLMVIRAVGANGERGDQTFKKGVVLLLAGSCAANIWFFEKVMANTVGINLSATALGG